MRSLEAPPVYPFGCAVDVPADVYVESIDWTLTGSNLAPVTVVAELLIDESPVGRSQPVTVERFPALCHFSFSRSIYIARETHCGVRLLAATDRGWQPVLYTGAPLTIGIAAERFGA